MNFQFLSRAIRGKQQQQVRELSTTFQQGRAGVGVGVLQKCSPVAI